MKIVVRDVRALKNDMLFPHSQSCKYEFNETKQVCDGPFSPI
jgi:hypothetical protein